MSHHGVKFDSRYKQMREHVLAMKELWSKEAGSYDGEFAKFSPSWSWPKPVQKPNPPILLGGETDHTLRRIVEYCDGWLPRTRKGFDAAESMARLKRFADQKGRDFKSLTVTVFGAPTNEGALDGYRKAGIHGALFSIPDLSRDEILRHLDKLAPFANKAAKAAA